MNIFPASLSSSPSEMVMKIRENTLYPNLRAIRVYVSCVVCLGGFSGAVFLVPSFIPIFTLIFNYNTNNIIYLSISSVVVLWAFLFTTKLFFHIYDLCIDVLDVFISNKLLAANHSVKGS